MMGKKRNRYQHPKTGESGAWFGACLPRRSPAAAIPSRHRVFAQERGRHTALGTAADGYYDDPPNDPLPTSVDASGRTPFVIRAHVPARTPRDTRPDTPLHATRHTTADALSHEPSFGTGDGMADNTMGPMAIRCRSGHVTCRGTSNVWHH
jgi:hypothetical protein